MKKLIISAICLLPLLAPKDLFSQISILETGKDTIIGRNSLMGTLFIELSMNVSSNMDTTFVFRYRNERYPTLNTYEYIRFGNKKTLIDFRNIIMSVFVPPNNTNKDYLVMFKINEGTLFEELISVKTHRGMATTSAAVFVLDKGHVMPTIKSHWEKVFMGLDSL
jgi:hypothetical protein